MPKIGIKMSIKPIGGFSGVFRVETMEKFPSKRINEAEVRRQLQKAIDAQFELYPFEKMVSDCNLSEAEKKWAVEHLTYGVVEA
jgi:hypothetical protein